MVKAIKAGENLISSSQAGGGLFTMQDLEKLANEAEFKPSRMASLCSLSERQLQRLFKGNVCCTPGQWLRQLQCRLAKDLLCKGYSNKAVAAELKFANASHFCREFKRIWGAPPQEFARDHKRAPTHKITNHSWEALRNYS